VAVARQLAGKGDSDQALVELGKALGEDPRNQAAYTQLAKVWAQKKMFDRAAQAYRAALAIKASSDLHIELGLLALNQNRAGEAAGHFSEAVALDPKSAVGYLDLGIALLNAGRAEEAIPACRKALDLDPSSLNARHNLGFAYSRAGRYKEAIAELEGVLKVDPGRGISLYELASAQAEAGETEKAKGTLERLLVLDPSHAAARRRLEGLGKPQPR